MKYRQFGNNGFETSILGLGTMRLPVLENDNEKIDEAKAIEMIRHAVDQGINYVDTAYPYHGGNSEPVVGKALRDGYRERVKLVTKSPVWLMKSREDFERYLDEQLEKLQTDSIDVYLMHALNKNFWEIIKEHDGLRFLDEMKEKGKIKVAGFSFHGDYELFEEIINAYDWGMCMIQMNYMDQDTQAELRGMKLAGEKGIPVAIMEPLKGGLLADPPEVIQQIWDQADQKMSPVEWSFRWLGHHPEVKVILSGMSTMEQMDENLAIADRNLPNALSEKDLKIIEQVRRAYDERIKVPCTECQYCMPCPHGVNIPDNFRLFNEGHIYDSMEDASFRYNEMFKAESRASACVGCGECESKCPQNIGIIKALKEVDETLGKTAEA